MSSDSEQHPGGDSAGRNEDVRNHDVWLIVPCFNEGTVIEEVLRSARGTFPNIVAVDDGSADNSAAAIHRAGAHLVRHPVNLGQGAAIQTGVDNPGHPHIKTVGMVACDEESVVQRQIDVHGVLKTKELPSIPQRNLTVNKKLKNTEKI